VVSPHQIKFGKVVFGNNAVSKPHKVTIQNKSETTPVTFSIIGVSGDFRAQNRCGAIIAPDGKCVVTLSFSPTALGTRNGTLTINSNASNSSASVGLNGEGIVPKK
jgi:hypothetical protein